MKKAIKILALPLLGILVMSSSCSGNDDSSSLNDIPLTTAEIPDAIKAYCNTHFPDNPIVSAKKDIDFNSYDYDVYLSDNLNLEFSNAFAITDIDWNKQLPNSVVPENILQYVTTNYPTNFITDWELELNHQQVELNNTVELEFDLNGNFIRIDND